MKITQEEIDQLNSLYQGRNVCYGELHDHAKTGGTSDGKRKLEHWKGALEALGMDFAAILDHRQVRHMFLPEWDPEIFICGTEPGTNISDCMAEKNGMHYNMIFSSREAVMELLEAFPEYQFEGGSEGHFVYPDFTRERFGELIDKVKELGGFFVHPHPRQVMRSEDPCDYWFRDETGIEVFYKGMESEFTGENYVLWTELLACGKRVWACAGGDKHACAIDSSLTTIYAEGHTNEAYLAHLREGDFVCGSVGIRMCIGDTRMGGRCSFDGRKLICGIQDFHRSVYMPCHTYRVDVLDEMGVVYSQEISCEKETYFTLDLREDAAFCRVEVFDTMRNLRIAIGNPIWNG